MLRPQQQASRPNTRRRIEVAPKFRARVGKPYKYLQSCDFKEEYQLSLNVTLRVARGQRFEAMLGDTSSGGWKLEQIGLERLE
mmetsp:Transcript_51516/g.154665  ORF Transcript_51516/g.154665 Transcript_51516/m.154665 type:complete len:83 (-) Transcript_51516:232-480(-)